jgi:hypothetical protein
MSNPKFFTLFTTLNQNEVFEFRKHLKKVAGEKSVAYFVFEHIRNIKKPENLQVVSICEKLYNSTEDPVKKNLLNTLFDLHKHLREFLLAQKAVGDPFGSQFLWLTILQERKLDDEFLKQAHPFQGNIANATGKGINDYMQSMVVNHLVLYHRPPDKPLPDSHALLKHSHDLDIFYAVAQLKVCCELANLKNVRSEAIDPKDFRVAAELIASKALAKHPLFILYREVYNLITAPMAETYHQVIKLLNKFAKHVDPFEIHAMLTYLHNYAITQIRNGNESYWQSTHLLNKFGVDYGVFTKDGEISANQFNNIITSACQASDLTWAGGFITSHHTYLKESIRTDTKTVAEMIIQFEKKSFKKIVEILKPLDFKEPMDKIRAKSLVLRSMYELNDPDALDYCLVFETYLRRNAVGSREYVKGILNTVLILKMLIRRKMGKDQIMKAIQEAKPLYFNPWLLSKLQNYSKL